MTKIVQLVNTCRQCPNRVYNSGGIYECVKVDSPLLDDGIPEWCPLPNYPAPKKAAVAEWERRQGMRASGGWTWGNWLSCTEAEAQRVTGLQSWQVRRVCVCATCGGTGRMPSGVTGAPAPARSHLCEHDCAEGAVGGPRCEGPCAVLGLHPMDEVAPGVNPSSQPHQENPQ